MTRDEYLDSLRLDGQALADAAEAAGLDAEVGGCPGWDAADLVWHTGEVHWFWRNVVERRVASPSELAPRVERPAPGDLLAWYRDGVERLHAVLAATDPGTAVWTWTLQKDVAFIVRRMAQETAVHRWDAEDAAGRVHDIPAELAADGVDEFLGFFTVFVREGAAPLGGTVHFHSTDAAGEWVVTEPDPAGPLAVRAEHAKADAAVRAPAADLLLLLWRRRTLGDGDVEVLGDQGVLERLLARTDLE